MKIYPQKYTSKLIGLILTESFHSASSATSATVSTRQCRAAAKVDYRYERGSIGVALQLHRCECFRRRAAGDNLRQAAQLTAMCNNSKGPVARGEVAS